MTTTDSAADERAVRLARLRERRAGAAQPAPATPRPAVGDDGGRRRRSPATTAKIVTIGASTTAVLGMMAGYGIADRVAAMKPTLEDAAAPLPTASPDPLVVASTTPLVPTTPPTTQPPQVIVVVIDGATGLPISTDRSQLGDLSALDIDRSGGGRSTSAAAVPESQSAGDSAAAAGPSQTEAPAAPVAVPVAVDLAVPQPPPPPAPTPSAAPAPAPQPQADSGGS